MPLTNLYSTAGNASSGKRTGFINAPDEPRYATADSHAHQVHHHQDRYSDFDGMDLGLDELSDLTVQSTTDASTPDEQPSLKITGIDAHCLPIRPGLITGKEIDVNDLGGDRGLTAFAHPISEPDNRQQQIRIPAMGPEYLLNITKVRCYWYMVQDGNRLYSSWKTCTPNPISGSQKVICKAGSLAILLLFLPLSHICA
ncbi:hypothetical protein [Spirosoma utsteinense]|uniref:Uncharacterized protein n=1 Tax=Spirosoma utsteinense TaxID=2585773 RepID=A0ABR6WGT5_9BACT|nr:hypothetical protein [Spirosoma utsteinense]MBC3789381.1 hypothetical protein [Spirosoma utsteinense]MBC3795282.1 hypothetical protein [Spirosoma utsteinense]